MRRSCSLVLLVIACGSHPSSTVLLAHPVAVTPATPASPTRPAEVGLTEAEARGLVDRWLAAQNAGRFADYEALYADRFTGIKRVGPRTTSFDRARWLADRQRMFAAPMKVEATDVVVKLAGTTATVALTQAYSQKTFHDQGPKELVIVATAGGPRIAREEMLRSSVGARASAGMFVLTVGGEPYVVLATDEVPGADGTFEALGAGDGFTHSGRMALSADAAGVALATWRGRKVVLYPGAKECAIDGLYVVGVGTPHFGRESEWRGDSDGDGTIDSTPTPAAEQDELGAVSQMAAGHLASCAGGGVALAAPGVEWARVDDAGLAARATAAVAKRDDSLALDDEAKAAGLSGHWFDRDGGLGAAIFRAPDGRTLIVAGGAVGNGCGEFSEALFVAYRVDGKRLVALGTVSGLPTAAVALDGKGLPILVQGYHLDAPAGQAYGDDARELDLGFRDCPC